MVHYLMFTEIMLMQVIYRKNLSFDFSIYITSTTKGPIFRLWSILRVLFALCQLKGNVIIFRIHIIFDREQGYRDLIFALHYPC